MCARGLTPCARSGRRSSLGTRRHLTTSVGASLTAASLPILHRLEPELSHYLGLRGLKLLQPWWKPPEIPASLAVNCAGLRFSHPVGVAAGFDKNGDSTDALGAVGFSHVEMGTITPRPQRGNRKPRLLRIHASTALVNRMGFNNKGIHHAVQRLRQGSFRGIRGVSIGKNADIRSKALRTIIFVVLESHVPWRTISRSMFHHRILQDSGSSRL